MKSTPFITVEGPIGVGKTSLAKVIADHFQISLLRKLSMKIHFSGNSIKILMSGAFKQKCFFCVTVINNWKKSKKASY